MRSELLEVMGQLYQDGTLKEQEWKSFIKERVYSGEEFSYAYNGLGWAICKCHFADMLPEILYMVQQNLIDEQDVGKYDSYVDLMFEYREDEERFCASVMDTADTLRSWAMFDQEDDSSLNKIREEDYKKLMREARKENKKEALPKVGRNDPCPCGSGKKYKFCCLNKPKSPIDSIESLQERTKVLSSYPYLGNEKQEGRIYLADFFDQESIEIDKLLYLGLKSRLGSIWLKDKKAEEDRCRKYLCLAFPMFTDKVEKEGIKTFKEYDQKYSIHYFCEDWIEVLLRLLKKNGDKALYAQVVKCRKKMG